MSASVKKNLLILILVLQNLFYLLITLINFNSLRGTDYDKYGNYLDYFIKNRVDQIGLESGVSYYWFVSLFFDFFIREICPLCSDPIVGMNPTFFFPYSSLFNLLMLLKIIIYGTSLLINCND